MVMAADTVGVIAAVAAITMDGVEVAVITTGGDIVTGKQYHARFERPPQLAAKAILFRPVPGFRCCLYLSPCVLN